MRTLHAAAALLATATLAAGCTPSGTIPLPPTPTPAAPTATSAAPSAPSTAASVPFAGGRIADVTWTRFLQRADGGDNASDDGEMTSAQLVAVVKLPCQTSAPATDAQLSGRAGRWMSYHFNGPETFYDGSVGEVITRYGSVGAARDYIAALRSAFTACPLESFGDGVSDNHAIIATGFAGDESILINTTRAAFSTPPRPYDGTRLYYSAAIRIGDAVVVLDVHGWETGSAVKAHADRLIQSALVRATA